MDPPPLNEDACEIYAPADDGGLKVLAPGEPGYERRVSLLIAAFQDVARLETPTPEREERTARVTYLSDCIARARGNERAPGFRSERGRRGDFAAALSRIPKAPFAARAVQLAE